MTTQSMMEISSVGGQFLPIFIEKQLCTSDRSRARAVLHQKDTGVFFASNSTRDIYWGYMKFQSIADVLCNRAIIFEDNLKPDATLSRRQVPRCVAKKKRKTDSFKDYGCPRGAP